MPKETRVLADFSAGMIGSVAASDLSNNASPFMVDVDISSNLGKIVGREQDTEFGLNISGVEFIDQLAGAPLMAGGGTIGQYSEGLLDVGTDEDITDELTDLTVLNNRVYLSQGRGAGTHTPQWYGRFNHNNWYHCTDGPDANIENSWGAVDDVEAAITSPKNAAFGCTDGTYAYWAESGGSILNRSAATGAGSWTELRADFVSIKGLAHDGTNVYVIDRNTIYKLDSDGDTVVAGTLDLNMTWLDDDQWISGLTIVGTNLVVGLACTDKPIGIDGDFTPFFWVPIASIVSASFYNPIDEETYPAGLFEVSTLPNSVGWYCGFVEEDVYERRDPDDIDMSQYEWHRLFGHEYGGRLIKVHSPQSTTVTVPEAAVFNNDSGTIGVSITYSNACIPVGVVYDNAIAAPPEDDRLFLQQFTGGHVILTMNFTDWAANTNSAKRFLYKYAVHTSGGALSDSADDIVGTVMPYSWGLGTPTNSHSVTSGLPQVGHIKEGGTTSHLFFRVPGSGNVTLYAWETIAYSAVDYDLTHGVSAPEMEYDTGCELDGYEALKSIDELQHPAMIVYDGLIADITLVSRNGAAYLTSGTYAGSAFSGSFSVGSYGDVSIDIDEISGQGDLLTGYVYKYAISFLYDGYQEGELTELTSITIEGEHASALVRIAFEEGFDPGKRVTHVNLYRSARYGEGEDFIASPYRLVDSIEAIIDNFVEVTLGDGTYYQGGFHDTGKSGASYEALARVAETLSDILTPPHDFSLSLHGYRLLANVEHDDIEDEGGVILRSVQGRPSIFNRVEDVLRIKGQITAWAAFNNRVYAFDTANMYRVNIDSMYVEEETSGLGVASSKQVHATEFGMIIAGKYNVYLHDGARLQPIGDKIVSNDTSESLGETFTFNDVGYRNNTATPIAGFDSYTNSFYISFEDSTAGTSQKMYYIYHLGLGAWGMRTALDSDVSSTTGNAPVCMGNTDDGRLLIATSGEVYKVGGSARVQYWVYLTKNLVLNSGSKWCLYDVAKDGTGTILVYYWDGDSWETPLPEKLKDTSIQLALLGTTVGATLDSAALLIRRLGAHNGTI
jgi:hypothetical protein